MKNETFALVVSIANVVRVKISSKCGLHSYYIYCRSYTLIGCGCRGVTHRKTLTQKYEPLPNLATGRKIHAFKDRILTLMYSKSFCTATDIPVVDLEWLSSKLRLNRFFFRSRAIEESLIDCDIFKLTRWFQW